MVQLSDQEKLVILSQHIKNSLTNIYNLEVSLIAENATAYPNQDTVTTLTVKHQEELLKKQALEQELSTLNIE